MGVFIIVGAIVAAVTYGGPDFERAGWMMLAATVVVITILSKN